MVTKSKHNQHPIKGPPSNINSRGADALAQRRKIFEISLSTKMRALRCNSKRRIRGIANL